MRLISGSLVDAVNKSTAGGNNPRYYEMIIRCKTTSDGSPTKFIFQPSMFLEISWLMNYYGVVTVTELDFGPRVLFTTAAIA